MSLENVKITDLFQISADSVGDKDLLLISHPNTEENVGDVDIPYTSNSINVQELGNSIGKIPIKIINCWNFGLSGSAAGDLSLTEKLPRQGMQLLVSDFLSAMTDKSKRDSVLNSGTDPTGWYMSLPTSVVEKDNSNGYASSLSVRNDVIPNIAFVHRMFAYFAKLIADGTIISEKAPSYVGQIIHSTTLDTEDKVKGFYGGEQWIEHKEYFLRGRKTSGENVLSGIAGQRSSGGGQSITIPERYFKNFAEHKHSYNNFRSAKLNGATTTSIGSTGSNAVIIPAAGKGDSSWTRDEHQVFGGTGSSGGGTGNRSGYDEEAATTGPFSIDSADFIPAYKPVYIWERIR